MPPKPLIGAANRRTSPAGDNWPKAATASKGLSIGVDDLTVENSVDPSLKLDKLNAIKNKFLD